MTDLHGYIQIKRMMKMPDEIGYISDMYFFLRMISYTRYENTANPLSNPVLVLISVPIPTMAAETQSKAMLSFL